MKRWVWFNWGWFLWATAAYGSSFGVRVTPEWGLCRDEHGTASTTADATVFALGWGTGSKESRLFSTNLEVELASQTFMAESPRARTLTILDQQGLGMGMGFDLALFGGAAWRLEGSAAVGQSRTRSAVTYADRQEEAQYAVPYGRFVASTGLVVPVNGPVSLSITGGWREAYFGESAEAVDVSGTRARPEGGLTLTSTRVQPEASPELLTPQKISGWLFRLGLEADL